MGLKASLTPVLVYSFQMQAKYSNQSEENLRVPIDEMVKVGNKKLQGSRGQLINST